MQNINQKIRALKENEEVVKIFKYIFKPGLITAIVLIILVILSILFLFIFGKLESIIVDYDIRYNSLVFQVIGFILLAIAFGAVGYAIFISLKHYRRPGGKGIVNPKYTDGTSYKAWTSYLEKINNHNNKEN